MENENKIGAGIITISILTFIGGFFNIIGSLMFLLFKDSFKEAYKTLGIELPSDSTKIIFFVISILLVISTILLLMKNKIGVFGYFILQAISIIITIATTGFSVMGLILDLILPVLMAIFVAQKKDLYFNN